MSYSNPFEQGGWSHAGNGSSHLNSWEYGSTLPSAFGALPYPSDPSSGFASFQFTHFNPSILQCTIFGHNSYPQFHVVTDPAMPDYTLLKNSHGKSVALIEWQRHPLVDVRNVMTKQMVSRWLSVAPDRISRYMEIKGRTYAWVPHKSTIRLCTADPSPIVMGRICKVQGSVVLELSNRAIQMGLLEASLIATILLQSGRNID